MYHISGGFILTFTAGLVVGIACSCFLRFCSQKKKSNLSSYSCVLCADRLFYNPPFPLVGSNVQGDTVTFTENPAYDVIHLK